MVEKLDLNNEIILMKKPIQQSKICVINKLVKKLRLIDKTLGTNEKPLQSIKFRSRKDKITEQIKYLQHTSNVELARQCLITKKSTTLILTNVQSTNEDIALAHLSEFKIIKEKINLIKEKYNLNNDSGGIDWRSMVQEVGKKKKKKLTKAENAERNAKRKNEHKKEKELEKKRLDWLESNSGEKVDDDENDTDGESVDDDQQSDRDEDDTDEEDRSNNKDLVKKSTPIKKIVKTKITKNDHIDVDKLKSSMELNNIKPKPPLKMDSFFITETGHGYMANSAEERIQPVVIHQNDGLDRRKRRAQQFNTSTSSNNSSSIKINQQRKPIEKFNKPQWKSVNEFDNKKPKIETMTKGTGKPTSAASTTTTELENNAKLHPSWAAKQKLKPTISDFKGTKITFDD